uniref:P-type domain-containing protein n=1 Tax=Corvus moneduloides TaxID=1196302 RepID=A0A8U7MTK0_CORMO
MLLCHVNTVLKEPICLLIKRKCKVVARERTNCGYPGISAAECKKIGCCFNASVPSVPWCYSPKPKKVKKMCPNNPYTRINCGHPGIKPWECTKKGCCFRAHPAGVPWCFYHRVMEEGNVLQEMSPVSLWMLLVGSLLCPGLVCCASQRFLRVGAGKGGQTLKKQLLVQRVRCCWCI